jgi:hypothetical protein
LDILRIDFITLISFLVCIPWGWIAYAGYFIQGQRTLLAASPDCRRAAAIRTQFVFERFVSMHQMGCAVVRLPLPSSSWIGNSFLGIVLWWGARQNASVKPLGKWNRCQQHER